MRSWSGTGRSRCPLTSARGREGPGDRPAIRPSTPAARGRSPRRRPGCTSPTTSSSGSTARGIGRVDLTLARRASARSDRSRPSGSRTTSCTPSGPSCPPRPPTILNRTTGPRAAGSWPSARPRPASWRRPRGRGPARAVRGRDRPLPPPRPRLPRGRRPADQLPPPPEQPPRPGLRPGRRRPDPRGLRRGGPRALPVLQLRRRDADPLNEIAPECPGTPR